MNPPNQHVLDIVQNDLSAIEETLKENLNPNIDLVAEIANHILLAGGKRLRPLLTVLSARLCGREGDIVTRLSITVEYLHAATLLHDDLIDEATLRRSRKVAHLLWGNSVAVLVGDFLLARALSIAAKAENLEIINVISTVTEEMVQGEILQLKRKGHVDFSESEYLDIIRRKTAVLMEGACKVGAIVAGASAEKISALATYGFHLGMAFQMADDLLDYLSDSASLGKNIGTDIKEGKLTLPVIYSLAQSTSSDRRVMEDIITRKDFSPVEFERFLELLEKYGGIRYTQNQAATHVEQAKEALHIFTSSETRHILSDIADFSLHRKK